MTQQHLNIFFAILAFLFAISVHESAHAWMASRCGDQTARMLGRITLNPIKHIDPFGTVLLPLLAAFTGAPMFGWAKPTPVNPNNLRNYVRDDILVSVAGPVSNMIVMVGSLIVLALIGLVSHGTGAETTAGILQPLAMMFIALAQINLLLAIFNLIPIPPLDGSHVLRHALSGAVLQAYDRIGIFGLMALVIFGGRLLGMLIGPPMLLLQGVIYKLLGS